VNVLELAARAARPAGPDTLAEVTRERSLLLRFAAGRPTQATAIDDATVELAALRAGHLGRAETNSPEDEALAACARRAAAAASAAAAAGEGLFPGFSVAPSGPRPSDGDGHDPATAQLDPVEGGAALAAAFEVAAEAGLEAHGIWTAAEVERAVVAGEGAVSERTTDAYMKVICIGPGGRSGYAAQAAVGAGSVDARALATRAAGKALLDGDPAELPAGEHAVVFEPHAVGSLLDLVAFTAFNGLAHAEGRGALAGRLGEVVAAPGVNLSDSPTFRRTLPHLFDAEGTPKAPLPLIQDGVAHRVVHDIRSAALMGAASTGHALAPGGDSFGPHPTNMVLTGGGAADEDELCAPVERGIYVTRLWYENVVRPKETLVTAVTRDGTFLIEEGRITRPLHDLRLTDSVLSILASVQALTAAQSLTSSGEFYGRRFATGVVAPALRAGSVRFTGPAG
jgi:PmbA protein